MKTIFSATADVAIIACVLVSASSRARGQALYWSELIPGGGPGGNSAASLIKRSDINGNGISTIVPTSAGLGFVHSIEYEPSSNKLYWTDRNRGLIQDSQLDGSAIQTVITSLFFGQPSSIRGLAIDSSHSTMYWTDESSQTVTRSSVNGTGATNVVTGILSDDIAIDAAAAHLFFADNVAGPEGPHDAIDIAHLDGTAQHSITSGIYQLTAVDVDPLAQKVYWVDIGLNALNDTSIRRANYDGSGVQILLSNLPDVILDLEVIPELSAIFWSSRDDGTIRGADLNGANPHTIVSGLRQPGAIAVVIPEPTTVGLFSIGVLLLCGGAGVRQRTFMAANV